MSQPRATGVRLSLGGPISPVVKTLVIINCAVFVLMRLTALPLADLYGLLGLKPAFLLGERAYWQLFTYMFIHDSGWWHLIFNMLALYWFGSEIERTWGSQTFLRFYFGAGVVAALGVMAVGPHSAAVTIGASGAVMALLTAFACMFPNRPMLLMMVMPIKAKYMVMLVIGMELLATQQTIQDNTSHMAHLSGVVFALAWCYQRFGRFHVAAWRRLLRRNRRRGKLKLVYTDKEAAEKLKSQPKTLH